MGWSLQINKARIIGFELLSYESKSFSRVLAKYMEVSDVLPVRSKKTRNYINSNGSGRMKVDLRQVSITGTCTIFAIQVHFTLNY